MEPGEAVSMETRLPDWCATGAGVGPNVGLADGV